MSNDALKIAIRVKDDAVCTRFTTGKRHLARKDGKLIERCCIGEGEPLVVLVLVRIFVGLVARLEVAEALLDGGINVGLAVAGVATCVCALAALGERAGQG